MASSEGLDSTDLVESIANMLKSVSPHEECPADPEELRRLRWSRFIGPQPCNPQSPAQGGLECRPEAIGCDLTTTINASDRSQRSSTTLRDDDFSHGGVVGDFNAAGEAGGSSSTSCMHPVPESPGAPSGGATSSKALASAADEDSSTAGGIDWTGDWWRHGVPRRGSTALDWLNGSLEPPPQPPAALNFSVGSALHAAGTCWPCAYFHTTGCANGADCPFCHLCDADERRRRQEHRWKLKRREWKEFRTQERREGRRGRPGGRQR